MDESKKRLGGAKKKRLKKLKSLEVESSKCAKLTDLFGAGTTNPPAAIGGAASVAWGWLGKIFETCPKHSKKHFYIKCDVT